MSKTSNSSSNLRNNLMREMIAPQTAPLDTNPKARLLPLERIVSNPFQVRQDFSSPEALTALEELAENIRQHGILQPLIVRPLKNKNPENANTTTATTTTSTSTTSSDGGGGGNNNQQQQHYQIVAGERRYRAASLASLRQVPVVIEDYSDQEARLISLTENLQRRDLSFKEEVDFLGELDKSRSAEGQGGDTDLANLIHKSRTYVAKRLKLVAYPLLVEQVNKGELSINGAYNQAVEGERTTAQPSPASTSASAFAAVTAAHPLAEQPGTVTIHNQSDSENPHKVFPGNVLSSEEQTENKVITRRGFKAHLVPFIRLREAVVNLNQGLGQLDDEDRAGLRFEMEQLERELQLLRSKLQT